jgi:hypothetical protein
MYEHAYQQLPIAETVASFITATWRRFEHRVPSGLLMCGSIPRGQYHPWSDVDLLFVVAPEPADPMNPPSWRAWEKTIHEGVLFDWCISSAFAIIWWLLNGDDISMRGKVAHSLSCTPDVLLDRVGDVQRIIHVATHLRLALGVEYAGDKGQWTFTHYR